MNFFVPGVPRPQGSKKGFVNKKTGGVILTESGGQAHKDWRAVVALAAFHAMGNDPLWDAPLAVRLAFNMPRPKSHPKTKSTFPVSRPDLDKLARSVLDGLTHVCFRDDSEITSLYLHKRWALPDEGEQVGVQIQIWGDDEV